MDPDFLVLLVTFPANGPKVLFKLANRMAMMLLYANPLLLPTARQKPRDAARRSIRE